MKPSIVLFNANDIPAARLIAARHEHADVVVFDPTLVDRASEAGLGSVEYLTWDAAPNYLQANDEALRQAKLLGQEIDRATLDTRFSGLALGTWQHLNLYYLHRTLDWYGGLFEALAPTMAGRRWLVPMCDAAQVFYFSSFVPALLLMLQVQHSGGEFAAFAYGSKEETPHTVPDLRGERPADVGSFLLAHLPTCFYDVPYINAEIKASGKAVVNLCSPYWHVPLAAETTIPLVPEDEVLTELGVAAVETIQATLQRLVAPLDRHLARWISAPVYRARQVAELLAAYRAQMVSYLLLERHFSHALPARLLLSDHDTGLHGPLAAFARQHQLPTVVLPHSKASTDLEFVARNATVVFHPAQGDPVYDAQGHRPLQCSIALPISLRFDTVHSGPIQRIGLLLNGVSLSGVPGVDLAGYLPGIRRIVEWCQTMGLELVVRSRPGQTLMHALRQHTGLTPEQLQASVQGAMADFAERCDLCLMYDAPTSGAVELLSRGVPVLNAVVSTLTKRETATMNTAIIPRHSLDVVLRMATDLIADPQELHRFRLQQFLNFAGRYRESRALRAFL